MKSDKRMIFITTQNIYDMNIFGDILEEDNVVVHVAKKSFPRNKIKWLIAKIGSRISKKIKYMYYDIDNFVIRNNEEYYFIVESGALRTYDISYFKMLNKRNNVYLMLLLFNSMSASSPGLIAVKDSVLQSDWRAVFTFDRQDATEYGWKYFGLNYFSNPKTVELLSDSSDAYFVGGLKGNRDKLIIEVFEKLNTAHVKCDFDIFCYSDKQFNNRRYPDLINYYRQWKRYDEIQPKVASTNCIIEILQEGQETQSMRYFEAIYYNKKLLTNNPNIVRMPFYDKRYMKYFKKAEDIDVNWIKKKVPINYSYAGEFSTIHLLEQITETIATDMSE